MKYAMLFSAAAATAALFAADPVTVSVDFDSVVGKVRPELHSSSFNAPICSRKKPTMDAIKAMGFTMQRTHDWALLNANERVCDWHHIFPLVDKDASDPSNYVFGPTDYLLDLNMKEFGTRLFFRLGTSIEHSGDKVHFNSAIPKDFDKVAEVFAATVRHYNRGWANGFEWNIPYWEIWNEPDGHNNMFCLPEGDRSGDRKEQEAKNLKRRKIFIELFVKCLKRMKDEFGDTIKVGGPALCSLNGAYLTDLLKACKAAGVAPDFISWHAYCEGPEGLIGSAKQARQICDKLGFNKCELIINEWHYFSYSDYSWDKLRSADPKIRKRVWSGPRSHNGIDSSCFNLATLADLQYSVLDQAYYYGCRASGSWGFMDEWGDKYKVYYGLKMFGDFLRTDCGELCRVTKPQPGKAKTVTAVAAKSADGKKFAMVVSDYRVRTKSVTVEVKGVPAGARVKAVVHDNTRDWESVPVTFADGKLVLEKPDEESSAWLITFE